ncbi:MAG: PQQ-like beta-propeller repeat protein [Acidobacteria bacterium]|nr:PQQ-like beta-propeller repeat protein [Acidobacteriota bacterium]
MRRAAIVIGLIVGFTIINEARQADVTQWRGANRDGVVTGFTPPATWPEQLTERWKVEVGLGYATPIVVGNRVYVFSRQGTDEVMSGIDAATGKVLWRTAYPAVFEMSSASKAHGPGPKSTPIYSNARLYSIGMTGTVTAYDAATGKQIWQKPGSASNMPMYTSHSFSPIVDRGLVIFHVGGHDKGALTAFDLDTGAEKWSWAGDGPGYGSPIIAEFGGVRQLVAITQGKLVGIDVATGALLWERPFASSNFTNSITPVRFGQSVIVWNNVGPMRAVNIARKNNQWVAEDAWQSDEAPNRLSNTVLDGDVMFGLTSRNMGQYYAVDVKTGKTLWASEGRQAANVALARAGNIVFSLENDGELVIVRASRTGFEPLKRYRVAPEEMYSTWAQPAISGNRIFIKDASTLALWTLN